MDRRQFLQSSVSAGVLGAVGLPTSAAAQDPDRFFYELRIYELRSDTTPARLQTFVQEHYLPAAQRAGVGPVGVFNAESGFARESLVTLASYPSAAALYAARQRLQADRAYRDALRAFEGGEGFPYLRYESRLLQSFTGHPRIEVPRVEPGRAPRVFEMRTYESRNALTLERKIDQFNQVEIEIFRKSGINPVFFAEDVFGPRLPSLTYMVAFDDMAARQRAWTTFRAHPEWAVARVDPRWNVEGAVSSSQIVLLNPLPFSQIR